MRSRERERVEVERRKTKKALPFAFLFFFVSLSNVKLRGVACATGAKERAREAGETVGGGGAKEEVG